MLSELCSCVAHHTSSFLKLILSWFHPNISFLDIVSSLSSPTSLLRHALYILHASFVNTLCSSMTSSAHGLCCCCIKKQNTLYLHPRSLIVDGESAPNNVSTGCKATTCCVQLQKFTRCLPAYHDLFKAPHEIDLRVAVRARIIKMCMDLRCRLFPAMTLTQDVGTSMNILRVLQ